MRKWFLSSTVTAAVILVILGLAAFFLATATAVTGQSSTLPRTPDGKPDLQGIWQVLNTAAWDIQDHHAQLGAPAGQGVVKGNIIPYTPEAAKQKQHNFENRETLDLVESRGFLPGVPRIMYMPFPFQIFQTEDYITMLFEYAHAVRIVYTDGTAHHGEGVFPFYMGDSRGYWEGDTLVVDVRNFNDIGETWFDKAGNHHSGALRLVERYTLMGPDHIQYEVTVEDPEVFTRPWEMSMLLYRRKEQNLRILEYEPGALLREELQQEEK